MGFNFTPIQDNDWQGLNIILEQLCCKRTEAATTQQQATQTSSGDSVYVEEYTDAEIEEEEQGGEEVEPVVESPTKKELKAQKKAARKAAREARQAERKQKKEAKKASKQEIVTETYGDAPQVEQVEITGIADAEGVKIYNKNIYEDNLIIPGTAKIYKTQARIVIPSSYYLDLRGIFVSTALQKYTADVLVLHDVDGNTVTLTDVSEINGVAVGPLAGGRDQSGAFDASSWIHFFIIYNPVTGDVSSLSSASPTAPTLPTGYTFFVRVGAAYFNASSEIVVSYQMNDKVVFNMQWPKWDTHATSTESIDIAAFVPDTAKMVHGVIGLSSGTASKKLLVTADSGGVIKVGAICDAQGTGDTAYGVSGSKEFTLPLITSQTIWWATESTADIYAVGISGFTDDL